MNRKMTAVLAGISIFLCGCAETTAGSVGATRSADEEITLNVVTTYGGQDGNANLFQEAVHSFEEKTGITVQDDSETADEVYKNRILTDFRTGQEPDVLFFFTGTDADEFIRAGRVMPISRIQEDYPEYAANYEMSRVPASPADGVQYALPVNGYWEALFC
ncbi:MAG: ABC transporter substrate-binding protein, partial [Lachnospiraceae bacterium]